MINDRYNIARKQNKSNNHIMSTKHYFAFWVHHNDTKYTDVALITGTTMLTKISSIQIEIFLSLYKTKIQTESNLLFLRT